MISTSFCARRVALFATTALVLTASAVQAQDNTVQLGAVQVEGQVAPDANPYADPAAPYKADRLSSSKFSEPVLNTPRSETIITKEALDDKNATSLRDVARSTAGVTLGTGEGGNAFGDRFFIRGFDARNDIFVDGVRDPGVLVRENFDTEQVEILRGPASSFAGRGTTGGALNVVTKKARDGSFYDFEATGGLSDDTNRLTFDVNQTLDPTLDVRVNGMIQNAHVAGRDFVTDNRRGIAGAATWRPTEDLTIDGNISYTYLYGLPDFGVPYNPQARRPVTSGDVSRNTYYGAINRDFTRSAQSSAGLNTAWVVNEWLTLENGARLSHSLLNYIGTIPENPSATTAVTAPFSSSTTKFSGYTQLNAQSRYEPVTVAVDQPQATFFFDTGPIHHTAVAGGEFSSEHISIAGYSGLTSELTTGAAAFTSSGAPIVPDGTPTNVILTKSTPTLSTNPQLYKINTSAGYVMDTANYNNFIIFNAGVRFDAYKISASNATTAQRANSGVTSYNAGLVVKPADEISLYAAFATAAEPVGDEVDATASAYGGLAPTQPTAQIFGPQKSNAYEIGAKWALFDEHLLATAAAFRTDVTNARETAPAALPGFASGQVYANAAYRVEGLDFGLTGNVTDDWSVQAGLVIMAPKITRAIVPTNVGLQLANIAPQSFNVLTKYNLRDWLAVGGQALYDSKIKGGSLLAANGGVAYPGTPYPTMLPAHWRFDAFVEGIVNDHILLRLNAQNIFDKTYYDTLYQSAVPFIGIAPGRSVTVTAEVKF
jgi:catecholate siderophore receptor